MKTIRSIVLALFATALLGACTPHRTGVTEVGVRFNKLTRSVERAAPGATYLFVPVINDWKKFDTSTQSLVMNAESTNGDRASKDDLRFKTRDGNDI
jgi:hypothetical protein